MSMQTRMNGSDKKNCSISLVENGEVLATITVPEGTKINLEVETSEGIHISKPSGWVSTK